MLYLNERLWFSSTFTFATLTAPAFSRATSSSSGAIILHGPHHSAQKSTITGLSSCVSSRSKRSEEHTSELQSRENLVCRLLLEKKKTNDDDPIIYDHTLQPS